MIPPGLRDDLAALVDLATVAAAGMTDRAFAVVDSLIETPRPVPDPAGLVTARQAQRSAAGVAQTLDQLRAVLQRQALGLLVDDGEDEAAAGVRATLWCQLRGVISELDKLSDRLIAITLTAGGPGPIDLPGEPPQVPGLAELLASRRAGTDDSGESDA